MKTLILTSVFTFYAKDENGKRRAQRIDNENGFLDNLQKELKTRKCLVVISGNPKMSHKKNPIIKVKEGFALSDISFDEYIYVNDKNKQNIKEYIAKADCIDLCGGHLPTCNAFINELNLRELIKDFNGVIIGASGGAMNMADPVYCKPEAEGEGVDSNFKRYLEGLGLTDIRIIPHYDFIKDKMLDGKKIVEEIILPDTYQTKLIALCDGSYIIQKENKKLLYGEAYLMENGLIKQICKKDHVVEL